MQIHEKPKRQKTFGEHVVDGWYIKTSPEHYRCHIIFVRKTRKLRITDTVFFKHKHLTQPTLTAQDRIVKAVQDLTVAITGKVKSKLQEQYDAIKKLTGMLTNTENRPNSLSESEPEPKGAK